MVDMQEKEDKERQEWKRKDVKILKDGLWWDCRGGVVGETVRREALEPEQRT